MFPLDTLCASATMHVGAQIANSLRFNSGASQYLSRTFGTPTNNKIWTFSAWIKRSNFPASSVGLFGSGTLGSNYAYFGFLSGQTFQFQNNASSGNQINATTSSVFRDPTAHMHIVLAIDTTQATNSNGVKLYTNGAQQTLTFSTYTQNTNTLINASGQHVISDYINGGGLLFGGYLSDIYFVDGQALSPTDFGETNADGVWVPRAYTGTYGNNGFHLDFADGTSTTTLGYDAAGSNDWTLNGMTRAAGVNECWMTDTPTNNYATWNKLAFGSGELTFTNGALMLSGSTSTAGTYWGRATQAVSSGKWYWEVTPTDIGAGPNIHIGIQRSDTTGIVGGTGGDAGNGYAYYANGNKLVGAVYSAYGASYANNDVIGVLLDCDANTVTFYKQTSGTGNFSSQGSISITAASYTALIAFYNGGAARTIACHANFGQRTFNYVTQHGSLPSSAQALCTANLPPATITNPRKHFDVVTHAGNSSTQSITSAQFQPDLVWIKGRNTAYDHHLFDAVRTLGNKLSSNLTDAEAASGLTSFNPNGFSMSGGYSGINASGTNYVDWLWKANGASSPSANTTAGFSIVSYSGNNTSNRTITSGLSRIRMAWIKSRGSGSFYIWHGGLTGNDYFLKCNNTDGTAAQSNSNSPWGTAPSWSSTTFQVTNNATNNLNAASTDYIAYLWDEVPGFSKFGSYTGNGSTDGPFVFCGFRPRWVMYKRTDTTGDWVIVDSARPGHNVIGGILFPNLSNAEDTTGIVDITSSGFKLRTAGSIHNASGGTYIFCAFAEFPNGSNVAPAPAR